MLNTLGDHIMSVGDIRSTPEGAEYNGNTMMSVMDIMSTQEMFSTPGFPYKFNCFLKCPSPHL